MSLNLDKVHLIMVNKGIKSKDLAKKMDVSEARVSRLLNSEGTKHNNRTIKTVAKALSIEPKEIII